MKELKQMNEALKLENNHIVQKLMEMTEELKERDEALRKLKEEQFKHNEDQSNHIEQIKKENNELNKKLEQNNIRYFFIQDVKQLQDENTKLKHLISEGTYGLESVNVSLRKECNRLNEKIKHYKQKLSRHYAKSQEKKEKMRENCRKIITWHQHEVEDVNRKLNAIIIQKNIERDHLENQIDLRKLQSTMFEKNWHPQFKYTFNKDDTISYMSDSEKRRALIKIQEIVKGTKQSPAVEFVSATYCIESFKHITFHWSLYPNVGAFTDRMEILIKAQHQMLRSNIFINKYDVDYKLWQTIDYVAHKLLFFFWRDNE